MKLDLLYELEAPKPWPEAAGTTPEATASVLRQIVESVPVPV